MIKVINYEVRKILDKHTYEIMTADNVFKLRIELNSYLQSVANEVDKLREFANRDLVTINGNPSNGTIDVFINQEFENKLRRIKK